MDPMGRRRAALLLRPVENIARDAIQAVLPLALIGQGGDGLED